MSDTPRRRLGAEERRRQVIDAAVDEFAACGYIGGTTESIARRAGISQAYLFRLFAGKKQIFLAAAHRGFDQVEEVFRRAVAGDTTAERLDAMSSGYIALVDDRHLLAFQLQIYAAASADEDIRALAGERFQRLYALVGELSGADAAGAVEFMALGMLLNVTTTLDIDMQSPGDSSPGDAERLSG